MEKLLCDRRSFLKAAALIGACAFTSTGIVGCSSSSSGKTYLYSGSWDEKGGTPGLYKHTYDASTGTIGDPELINKISVGFILIDYERGTLYVTEECDNPYDKDRELSAGAGGNIWVYSINPQDGSLQELQTSPSYGSNPSMVSFSPDKQFLLCSIHTAKPSPCHASKIDGKWEITPAIPSANCVVFPIKDDGTLDSPCDIMTFDRKEGRHVSQLHTVTWAPSGAFFVIADKGTGDLYSMGLDVSGKLAALSTASLGDGYSCRYVRFSPDSKYCYVNFESANEVVTFSADENGNLTKIGSGIPVPEDIRNSMPKGCKFEQQDMKITNDGTIIYDVVRGSNDDTSKEADTYGEKIHSDGGFQGVSVLKINSSTGIPERVQWIDLSSQQGWWPRGIALTPAEDRVVVACLYGDKLIEIPINDDGTLDDTNMKAFDQDTAANLTFYDPSLKE